MSFNQERFFGIYLGRVEYNLDPLQRGRVKVRVFNIDGDETVTSSSDLNWAEILNLGGAGWDYGSFDPPEVGSTVYISYINGNPTKPVVIGGYYLFPTSDNYYIDYNPKYPKIKDVFLNYRLRKFIYENYELQSNVQTINMMSTPHSINNYPMESQTILNNQPTKKILKKTIKGHSIIIDDRDGNESFEILDRGGQGLVFKSNVKREIQTENQWKRGIGKFEGHTAIPNNQFIDDSTEILLKDINNNGLIIKSKSNFEEIVLRSNGSNSKHKLKIQPGIDNFSINIFNDNKNPVFSFNVNDDGSLTIMANNNINLISQEDIIISGKDVIISKTNEKNYSFSE